VSTCNTCFHIHPKPLHAMDAFLTAADNALRTLFATPRASEASPANGHAEGTMTPAQRKLAGSLMRVNHVGEVCAQALYTAQALATRDERLREQLEEVKTAPDDVPARVAALVEERRKLERELAEAKKALALGGGAGAAPAGPEQVNGINFVGQVLDGLEAKALRGAVDEAKARIGSGVVALVAVNEGRASVAVGVSDGIGVSAVDLVKVAVAVLGGQGGGGRPDMAQGGGPDGAKGADALAAVKAALAEAQVAA